MLFFSLLFLFAQSQSEGLVFFEGFAVGIEAEIGNPQQCAQDVNITLEDLEVGLATIKDGIYHLDIREVEQGILDWSNGLQEMINGLNACGANQLADDIEKLALDIQTGEGILKLIAEEVLNIIDNDIAGLFRKAINAFDHNDMYNAGLYTGQITGLLLNNNPSSQRKHKKAGDGCLNPCGSPCACCGKPANGIYFLTAFDGVTCSCGACHKYGGFFAADRQRFGCGTALNVCRGSKCVHVRVTDYGPSCFVERDAGGPVLDASPSVCESLTGHTSCGWSDHFAVSVHVGLEGSRPVGPFTVSADEFAEIVRIGMMLEKNITKN